MGAEVCAMRGQHGCSGVVRNPCEECERVVCDLHAVNTYGSFHYCIRCYTRAVAAGSILPELWDEEKPEETVASFTIRASLPAGTPPDASMWDILSRVKLDTPESERSDDDGR